MSRAIRRAGVLSVLILGAFAPTGCYTYRAQAPGAQPKTEVQGEVVWSFAWGLVQENPEIPNCNEGPLAEVTTRNNFGFALLTVVSLGLASPVYVEWSCAGDDPEARPFDTSDDE